MDNELTSKRMYSRRFNSDKIQTAQLITKTLGGA